MSKEKEKEYINYNGVNIPIVGEVNSETSKIKFYEKNK